MIRAKIKSVGNCVCFHVEMRKIIYDIIITVNSGMQQLSKIIFDITINTRKLFTKTAPGIDQTYCTAIAVIENVIETKIAMHNAKIFFAKKGLNCFFSFWQQ